MLFTNPFNRDYADYGYYHAPSLEEQYRYHQRRRAQEDAKRRLQLEAYYRHMEEEEERYQKRRENLLAEQEKMQKMRMQHKQQQQQQRRPTGVSPAVPGPTNTSGPVKNKTGSRSSDHKPVFANTLNHPYGVKKEKKATTAVRMNPETVIRKKQRRHEEKIIVEDASDSECEEESIWRNRRPSPGQWIEPVLDLKKAQE